MISKNKKKKEQDTKELGRAYFFEDKKNKSKTEIKSNLLSNVNINQKDFYKDVKCPKCNHTLVYQFSKNNYSCSKCTYQMSFVEYQKRYININWFKSLSLGIRLYSWDSECPNCKNYNPCISYCINQSFGSEEMCYFEPILLGKLVKIDNFIMKFCQAINLFPNEKNELSAAIFCSKCDAPYSYDFLLKSFLDQKILDVEFIIKKDVLQKIINLKANDVISTILDLKKMEK